MPRKYAPSEGRSRTTFYCDDEVLRRSKYFLDKCEMTLSELLENKLREFLDECENQRIADSIAPPGVRKEP